MSPAAVRRALLPLGALALSALAPALVAQTPADRTVRGTVRTADGAGVVGATVWTAGTRAPTDSGIAGSTDEQGAYRFTLPVSDRTELLVRRRGFADARVPLRGEGEGTARRPLVVGPVTLQALVEPLVTATVRDTGRYEGREGQFFRNLAARRGDFMTRSELARLNPTSTAQVLRMLRGVSFDRARGGGTYVRLSGRPCIASVFLDGAPMGSRAFDIDVVAPQSLMAVEVYAQPGGLPAEYQTVDAISCGAVGLWTHRVGEAPDPLEPATPSEPAGIRVAREVDEPARLAEGERFAPAYMAEARATGVGGRVIVELVVDTLGAVERPSVGVVAAASPLLAPSVVRAAQRLRFVPARAGGRAVRQLVHVAAEFQSSTPPRTR